MKWACSCCWNGVVIHSQPSVTLEHNLLCFISLSLLSLSRVTETQGQGSVPLHLTSGPGWYVARCHQRRICFFSPALSPLPFFSRRATHHKKQLRKVAPCQCHSDTETDVCVVWFPRHSEPPIESRQSQPVASSFLQSTTLQPDTQEENKMSKTSRHRWLTRCELEDTCNKSVLSPLGGKPPDCVAH